MNNRDLQEFIYFFQNHRGLTRVQKAKRDSLLVRDCNSKETDTKKDTKEGDGFIALSALDTATFLSKFNDRMGLKFLTHNFDYINDGSPETLEQLLKQVDGIILSKELTIPKTLWALINGFLSKGIWMDTYGKKHNSCISNKGWIAWSETNHLHPLKNPEYEKEIMAFRSTIRLVAPSLNKICDKASEGLKIRLTKCKLDSADFYTNTYFLFRTLQQVFTMMNNRAGDFPDVSVSFKRSTDSEGRMLRHVIVTQNDSFASKSIEDVKSRLEKNSGAGDFGTIRNYLNGYCLWQVESLWDGKPYIWNILRTPQMEELEVVSKSDVKGFTHIFTFYIV